MEHTYTVKGAKAFFLVSAIAVTSVVGAARILKWFW